MLDASLLRPNGQWPLGRVTEVHPGRDGLVRTATVKTEHGAYVRPIVKFSARRQRLFHGCCASSLFIFTFTAGGACLRAGPRRSVSIAGPMSLRSSNEAGGVGIGVRPREGAARGAVALVGLARRIHSRSGCRTTRTLGRTAPAYQSSPFVSAISS